MFGLRAQASKKDQATGGSKSKEEGKKLLTN